MGGEQLREFKGMVKALHRAGIEVILDVVYNHTAEGNHLGPMLAFRGIDNPSYYRLSPDDQRYYVDYTGTGNSLNPVHPSVLRLIMDSLRYFAVECHVDGFRFDLAAALAREFHAVNRLSAFFDIIHQDPILSQVKLIAEPWDVGEGGYQVGNFPILWTEWNGLYRDVMRDFWRGDARIGDFTDRFAGSADLYERDGRRPFASINFVTAHDGFTLADLVSYNHKHNDANLEDNRDGTDDNRSWNCGVEGPSDDPEVNALRARQQRNFIATLLLSQGVPMLLGGDEIGRTQHGNNNAYCQDNEISWYDWNVDGDGEALHEFTRRMIELRAEHPVFRRTTFFAGDTDEGGLPDVFWFRPDGRRMTRREWDSTGGGRLGVFLNGDALRTETPYGESLRDDSFLVIFNAFHEETQFLLPARRFGRRWRIEVSTAEPDGSFEELAPRRRSPSRRARSWCCAGFAERDRSRRDLSTAARSRLRLRGRARSSCRISGRSASATSICRRSCRPAKGRRTDTTSSTRRACPTPSGASPGSGRWRSPGSVSSSTSSRTTWLRSTRTCSGASGASSSSTSIP